MIINCKVNVAESIRRGIDTAPTASIEIDPSTLPDAARAVLAALYQGGNFKTVDHVWPPIPEPTTQGLVEILKQLAAGDGSSCRKQFHNNGARQFTLPDGSTSDTPEVGALIHTENEPSSPWPPGNYICWRVTDILSDSVTVNTVLDLPASAAFSAAVADALSDRP